MSLASRPAPARRARSAARLAVVQALYQMELSGSGVDAVVREFCDHRFGAPPDRDAEAVAPDSAPAEADEAFFGDLARGVVAD